MRAELSRWYAETRAAALRYAADRGLSPELAEEFADGVVVDRARGRLEAAHLDWRIKELKRRELGRLRGYGREFGAAETGFDEPLIVEHRAPTAPPEGECTAECAEEAIGGSLAPACTVRCAPAAPAPAARPRLERDEAEWLKAVRASAIGFGISRGLKPELAEEFAQEVVLERALGTSAATYRLDWRLTDFLRRELGDTRSHSPKGQARAAARHRCLNEPVSRYDERPLEETIAAPEPEPPPRGTGWRDRVVLTAREEGLLEMSHEHDLDQVEIADALGVTPARVSQLMRRIERKIAAAAVADELLADYLADPDASKLEVAWL